LAARACEVLVRFRPAFEGTGFASSGAQGQEVGGAEGEHFIPGILAGNRGQESNLDTDVSSRLPQRIAIRKGKQRPIVHGALLITFCNLSKSAVTVS
jgi:hypothetical protein